MEADQKPQQTPFATINCGPGIFQDGSLGVMVYLSVGAITLNEQGDPCSGLCLSMWQARRLAYRLLQLAEEQDAEMRGVARTT
jgi:hypothetical protein